MTTEPQGPIGASAVAWRLRLRDGGADAWEEFADWLALDPRNAAAYDEVALADRALDDALADWAPSRAAATNDNDTDDDSHSGKLVRWWWPVGGLAAAAAAALLLLVPTPSPNVDFYTIATAAGRQRVVTLDGGDRIALNGGTTLRLDRHNPRFARLDRGEAAFNIVHDAAAPFTLVIGSDRLVDVGTRFNVVHTAAGKRIDVAEGAVLFNPDGEKIPLAAGQSLGRRPGARAVVSKRPVSDMGGWQHGRLSYTSVSLAEVGADLARSLGTSIAVQPAIADRSFTGTIKIDRNEDRMFARLSQLLDVDARRVEHGWTIGPAVASRHQDRGRPGARRRA